jgi:8-amino-7-oxononanoate synthase
MASSPILQRMAEQLDRLDREGQLRAPAVLAGVNFCSNDYLGLSSSPGLKAALQNAIQVCDRIGSTGSRLLSGHHHLWEQLEDEFALFAGTDAALFFTSGYAANVGLLSSLITRDDVVFSDELNHASIIDGIRLSGARKVVYPHADLNFLEDALRRENSSASRTRLIVTETIFSMDGDQAQLRDLFSLANRYGAEIVVDEAHATGVYGPRGAGLVAELGLQRQALSVLQTCGKALAGMGAFVCGSAVLKRFLVNRARTFMFTTALPPYAAMQITMSLRLAQTMEAERDHVRSLAAALRKQLTRNNFDCGPSNSHIVPLMLPGCDESVLVASRLQALGFAVRPIRPPTVAKGRERLRLSLTAKLTNDDLHAFTTAVSTVATRQNG